LLVCQFRHFRISRFSEKVFFLAATDISITKGYMIVNTFFEKN
jgi:hypothetical protein